MEEIAKTRWPEFNKYLKESASIFDIYVRFGFRSVYLQAFGGLNYYVMEVARNIPVVIGKIGASAWY